MAVAGILAACGSHPATTAPPATPASPAPVVGSPVAAVARPAPTPPALRLPTDVQPTGYELELSVDPTRPSFGGRVAIDVQVGKPTDVVWLNAEAITVDSATIGNAAVEVIPASAAHFVGLRAAAPLPVGATRIEIRYHGVIAHDDSMGVFAQKIADDWYAYTQFEPLGARRAFPCFDEPSFKVPWQVTLHAPRGLVVASNTPIAAQSDDPSGGQTVRFERTPPLPSYLVAFAIGPFEIVDAGKAKGGAPVRVFTPRGQAREAAYAAEVTAPLLSLLEGYFGMPYPFAKLDVVPIPQTFNFGAMENPGLITYVEDLLLRKPEELTIAARRRYAGTAVHEMAHQWFGNLVTTAWWDDIWLNEALASWLPSKILNDWQPSWQLRVSDVRGVSGAMGADSLDTARRVREPIRDNNDIDNAFDGITYGKGSAVLRMMELWVGEQAFQKGIRAYLGKRARGVATYDNFVADMSEAVGRDLSGPLSTFFEQTGVPQVSFALRCDAGKPPRLELAQKRYLPVGSAGERARTWQVPVCVEWSVGGKPGHACTLLAGASGELLLAGASKCPDFVVPNQGGTGYYRSTLSDDLWKRLTSKKVLARLSAGERLAVRNDVSALVSSGEIDLTRVLALSVLLADDPDRNVRSASVNELWGIYDMVPDAQWPSYQRAVRKLFGAAAHKIGFQPRQGESEDTALLRPTLINLVGDAGGDEAIAAEARTLAWKWLDDHAAVAPEMVDTVLGLAAARGDAKLYDRVLADARKAKDLQDRARLLGMLGNFRDPALVARSLDLALGDDLPLTETIRLVWAASRHKETRDLAWKLVTEHYDALVARLPKENAARFVSIGSHYCSEAKRQEVAEFFKERNARALGGPRLYKNALESLSLCVAYRARQQSSVEAFLKQY